MQLPISSTTPDDVFYILKAVISRTLSMGSMNGFTHMMAQFREIIEKDYGLVLKKKLDDVYRNAAPGQGGARGEKVDRENRISFIVSPYLRQRRTRRVETLLRRF